MTISKRGRFQFSTEKAYSVRASSSSRAQVSTTSRTEAIPARWPSTRGEPAQLGPASVAVHDDGDVPGQLVEIDLVDELSLQGSRRRQVVELDHGVSLAVSRANS